MLMYTIRLSHRFSDIATDSQLWKDAYYQNYQIPGMKISGAITTASSLRAQHSERLGSEHLTRKGSKIDWKIQYRLRHNWSHGLCRSSEIHRFASCQTPGISVQFHDDVIISVDVLHGLRAWSIKGSRQPLGPPFQLSTNGEHSGLDGAPTSLSIDSSKDNISAVRTLVGFTNGSFGIYDFDRQTRKFSSVSFHHTPTSRSVSSVTYSSPYLAAMIDTDILYLYQFPSESCSKTGTSASQLLASLTSHTAWPPLSISIRETSERIILSIIHALPTYLSGWSVGLQELRLTLDGRIVANRLASTVHQGFAPLPTPQFSDSMPSPGSVHHSGATALDPASSRPNSLSYSHPFLLAAHADNTLTLYLVNSTDEHLKIGVGTRLWGHTSSVLGAHIGNRGKTVTVAQGGEIRVWELENSAKSLFSKKRLPARTEEGISVRRESRISDSSGVEGLAGFINSPTPEVEHLHQNAGGYGWVGFDEERVVVLRENNHGTQALVMYDFSK